MTKQLNFKYLGKIFHTEYSSTSKANEILFIVTLKSAIAGYYAIGDSMSFKFKTITNKFDLKKIKYWAWEPLTVPCKVSSNITCSIFCALQRQETFL